MDLCNTPILLHIGPAAAHSNDSELKYLIELLNYRYDIHPFFDEMLTVSTSE